MATMNRPLLRFWKAMALFIPAWLGAAVIAGIVEAVIPASAGALAGLSTLAGGAGAVWVLVVIGGAVWSVVHVSLNQARAACCEQKRPGWKRKAAGSFFSIVVVPGTTRSEQVPIPPLG
jgi:hypothetical protein